MNTMTHMGQTARIEFDDRDNIFVGRLLGITDTISFHADTVVALRKAFVEAVDVYIETCAKIGKPVEKPANGKILRCVPPKLHSAALIAAEAAGASLNQWATKALHQAAHARD